MILSASRRTDLPNFYSEWLFRRIREGYLYVRNPMNAHQISELDLSPDVVDAIVFWTKNPEPMLARLDELKDYVYYFQFTLTGYGTDIEPGIPHKKEQMIPIFQKLAGKIGPERVVWRYDPILFTRRYTPEYHEKAFQQIARSLNGCTKECVISFVDSYAKNRKNLAALRAYSLEEQHLVRFAGTLSQIAAKNGMTISSCAEKTDLSAQGIRHSSCIDKNKIELLSGVPIAAGRDKNQREACGCAASVDIGTYDTCANGCVYCYANASRSRVESNRANFAPDSPLLCGQVRDGDSVTKRNVNEKKGN